MWLSTVLLAAFAVLVAAEPIPDRTQLNPRASVCTPTAGGSSSIDDVPAIESAIKACPSGTIVIPSEETYYINSQLSFAGCTGCTFQLNGKLLVSADFTYWNGKGVIILLSGITGATITGSGTVDGNGQASCKFGWCQFSLKQSGRPEFSTDTCQC